MNSLYKQNATDFFAASNTKDGFVSYFDSIFSENECDRIFILKGGPGVGKSTFMKKIATLSYEKGYLCELFHCSSDPDSLDGVIIKELRTAILDGTSPHTVEPKLAGAREVIINLGEAWDTQGLFENRHTIKELVQKKSRHYNDCYKYLYGKHVMDGLVFNLTSPYIRYDKLENSAKKLCSGIFKGSHKNTKAVVKHRLISACSSLGNTVYPTFQNLSDYCIFLKEPFRSTRLPSLFMKKIYETALELCEQIHISPCRDNSDEIEALYFPNEKVCISVYDSTLLEKCDRELKKSRVINCTRFLDTKQLSSLRPLRKFYCRLSENMENSALESLKQAGKTHAETEKIYRLYTDYKTVEKISDKFLKIILKG